MPVVTIFVADMDRAVRFYTEILGMKLVQRFGAHWAALKAEDGTNVGLHPASLESPAGRKGSITLGFETHQPIATLVADLSAKGVRFSGPILDDQQVKAVHFEDSEGNEMYFAEVQQPWKS